MGEIGTDRREYLYDLSYCDLLMIERGYERRHRHLWSATRWETYYLMMATCGTDALQKSGIHNPLDLLRFPWEQVGGDEDTSGGDMPTEAEVKRLRQMMMEENARSEAEVNPAP